MVDALVEIESDISWYGSTAPVLEATRQPRCEATGAVAKKNKS